MQKSNLGKLKRQLLKLPLRKLQKETEKIILQDRQIVLRKKAELKTGSNPDGSSIGVYRSAEYRIFKMQLNPLAGGKVDLILTGSTRDKLYVESLGNGKFTIKSKDEKWELLTSKYGNAIEAINVDVFNGFQKTIYAPKLISKMKIISGIR